MQWSIFVQQIRWKNTIWSGEPCNKAEITKSKIHSIIHATLADTNLSQITFGITMPSLNLISLSSSNKFSEVYTKFKFFDRHLNTCSNKVGRSSSSMPLSLKFTLPLIICTEYIHSYCNLYHTLTRAFFFPIRLIKLDNQIAKLFRINFAIF